MEDNEDEFGTAFDAEESPVREAEEDEAAVEQAITEVEAVLSGEDESLGDKPADSAAEGATASDAEAVVIHEGAPEGASPEDGNAAAEGDDVPEEDQQAFKSWEGRLRKREQELAAREAALAARAESSAGSDAAVDVGGADVVQRADGGGVEADTTDDESTGASDSLSSLKAEAQALASDPKRLAEVIDTMVGDFGRDYVVALMAASAPMFESLAEPLVKQVDSQIESLVNDVTGAFRSMHIGAISDAHDDFEQIVQSDEFKAYREGLTGDEAAAVTKAMQEGTPGQVIKMLNAFKASLKPAATDKPGHEFTMDEDAASGVRSSSPVRLPSRQGLAPDDEFAASWESS